MHNSRLVPSLKVCLSVLGITYSCLGSAQTIGGLNNPKDEAIIEPEKQTQPVKAAKIDTEMFELGVSLGFLNVEDFNTNPVYGLSFTYHIDSKYIAQLHYGASDVDKATFEELAGSNFLRDSDREFKYFELTGGYKVLHGRSFLNSKTKLNSSIYLIAGLGQVQFADNSSTGFIFGASYRNVLTDWLTMNIDIRDHVMSRDFINDSKTTNNTEFVVGLNALF